MATFNRLHQLLEQSLRDFQAEASNLSDAQEQELSQELNRLTGRFTKILSATHDPFSSSPIPATDASLKPLIEPSDIFHFNCVTSCEGEILMADEAMCKILGIDLSGMGKVGLAEYISQEEWRGFHHHMHVPHVSRVSFTQMLTLLSTGGASRKVLCIVTPMFDQLQKVTGWHWGFFSKTDQSSVEPLSHLVRSLEGQLYDGQSLNGCLTQICESLVRTFGFPFVWLATMNKDAGAQLRAHAVAADLDWDVQGIKWWMDLSRQKDLVQICEASEVSVFSASDRHSESIDWFPPGFQLRDIVCIPLACQESSSGVLVICSAKPRAFDAVVIGWLRVLGHQIEQFLVRGKQLDQWRLHSAAISSVNDAICMTDLRGRVEWVNEAFSILFGPSSQQLLGAPLSSFPHAQLLALQSSLSGSTKDLCVKSEIMQTGKNGESLVLEQVITPLINEQGDLTHFVAILHDITERKTEELMMKHQAYHDPLTDLPNRIMFEDRLQQALAQARRNGTLLALFFLDLDNFKSINDCFGHQIGDRVLRVVAKRLATCVRSTDTVARLCGDEFTVILQGLDRIQDIRQVAQKILDCLTPPTRVSGQDIPIQISIGIAVYPKDSTEPRDLVQIADQAMYRAKECGGQCWYFATAEWNVE